MSNVEKNDIINSRNISTKYGLLAGGMMAIALFLFQASGNDFSPFMKLSKYLLLAISILAALNIYKSKIKGNIFFNGLAVGTKLSLIAGLILAAVNFALFFLFPEFAFSKYGIEPSTLGQVAMISGVLFFESLVFGSLITFAVLQYLKNGGEVEIAE